VGLRSGIVARKLRAGGFASVCILSGCYYEWLHQRRPIWMSESCSTTPQVGWLPGWPGGPAGRAAALALPWPPVEAGGVVYERSGGGRLWRQLE
jgi:hypothetical protein